MTDQELLQAIREITKEEVSKVKEELTKAMDEKILPIQAALDHEITPAIKLLAEGHELILERLDDKITAKTEQLEWRVDAIEAVVKQHLREAK